MHKYKFLILGLIGALFIWSLDAILDTFFFSEEGFIEEFLHPSGMEIYFRSTLISILLSFATYAHFSTVKLRQSKQRFHGIVDMAADAIISINEKQQIILFNKAAEQMFEYTQADLLGQHVERLMPHRFRQGHHEKVALFLADQTSHSKSRSINMFGLRKSGQEFQMETSISKQVLNDTTIMTMMIRDITEQQSIQGTQQKLLKALSEAGEAVLITDKDAVIEYINPAFTKITGYTEKEVLGKTPSILKSSAQDPAFYKDLW